MSSRLRNASGPRPLRGLLAAAAITLLACGGDTAPTATPGPPVSLSVSPSELSLLVGVDGRLTAQTSDTKRRATSAAVEWSSASPSVATVRNDGTVTAIAAGATTVTASAGTLRATASVTVTATVTVTVEPDSLYEQWATAATASSEWSSDMWSAAQATGAPNVVGCEDDSRAWASSSADGVDWLELTYAQPVRPSEIRIHEVLGAGSIVKVEVKDALGE